MQAAVRGFIDCETYRYRGHFRTDARSYRPAEVVKAHEVGIRSAHRVRAVELRTSNRLTQPDWISTLTNHRIKCLMCT